MLTQLLTTLIALVAVGLSFLSPVWSWVLIAIPEAWIAVTLIAAKSGLEARAQPGLSPTANILLQRFPHYYRYPWAAQGHSSAASALTLASGIIGVISIFKAVWWSVGLGVVNYFVAALLAARFNPGRFLHDSAEQAAHNEIVDWIRERR